MKKILKLGFLIALVMALFTGCRTAPIRNYNSPVVPNASTITLDKVAKEIINAGASLGWQMKKVKDGEIIGTIYLRTHMAQIKIPYTTKNYRIEYMNSKELNYDASTGVIHTNYNGWVKNLNNAIQVRLGTL
ncbi:hypothetical protein [Sulfurospirillum arcachonense]|uniref:hypothetical protein n=1 Tax=Sulfurospirillum arcachonense TaxID=57666 RepID=UPI0004697258|nr:hypothetical protein [Sulfurospirillum arcachonense]